MRKGKFNLCKANNKHYLKYWYFTLTAGNGKVIATSEMYESKQAARNGIESVRRNAPDAALVEVLEEPEE